MALDRSGTLIIESPRWFRGQYVKKIAGIAVIFFSAFIGVSGGSHAADKRTDKLYELYGSTSTPVNYKRILKRSIDRRERIEKLRAKARRKAKGAALAAPAAVKTAGVLSAAPPTAAAAFKLGEVYCYPNPAKMANPTFHIETGLADRVGLKIYDVSGALVHETTLTGPPQQIDDGQGPQPAYEYLWDVKDIGSGVYIFSITSSQGDKTLKRTGRCAVIK